MLKKIAKLLTALIVITTSLGAVACTYRAEGSVIQDVDFVVSYENSSAETVDIDVTLKLFKTFSPKTCEHLLKIFKDGFYNDTSAVFTDDGSLLVLGGFTYADGEYTEKIYDGTPVIGEFARVAPKLPAAEGYLVMLREPDTDKFATKKNDTGKAMFAIVLDQTTLISPEKYTVFGRIEEDAYEDLVDMRDALLKDADGDIKARYLGDKDDETDTLIVENGKYVGGIEYYINSENKTIKNLDKTVIPTTTEDEEENPLYTKLAYTIYLDVFALPTKQISLKNIKIK